MGEQSNDCNIFDLPVYQTSPDPVLHYTSGIRKSKVPIVIDNGSYQCKAGWATHDKPTFVFRNQIARLRGKKENEIQVGNDIQNIEAIRWLLKTQFDKNVVTQFDIQETVLDYIFSHLGINTNGSVDHPIVMTESLCNPNYSRQLMSELLFECYQVPQVAYGIDALFSFHCNRGKENEKNGLVLSLGYNTTTVMPVLDKKPDVKNCCRINLGGSHMIGYMHRFLQLKYPLHISNITPSRSEVLFHNHMYVSPNFSEEINQWENEEYSEANMHKIQLPFKTKMPLSANATEAGKFEKCYSILRQVQAMKIKRRNEKLAFDEERLQELLSVQDMVDDDDDEAIFALQELGYSTVSELQAGIKELNCKIKKVRATIACQQSEETQDSPLQDWCETLDINNFTDVESWIEAVQLKKTELIENPIPANFGLQSNELSGFSFSRALDMIGGLHEICGTDQSYNDYISKKEERREHIEIVTEIFTQYNREFSKSEPNITYNMADFYQLHLGVDRIRIPEIIFQPEILGVEQSGLAETVENLLSRYNSTQQQLLAENVFITGGCTNIPFMKDRINAEILAMRPFQSKFHVHLAKNPSLDAWRGAKIWSTTRNNLSKYSITKAEYEEKGGDCLKQHSFSNVYYPSLHPNKKGLLLAEATGSSVQNKQEIKT